MTGVIYTSLALSSEGLELSTQIDQAKKVFQEIESQSKKQPRYNGKKFFYYEDVSSIINGSVSQAEKIEKNMLMRLADRAGQRVIRRWKANEQSIFELKEAISSPLNNDWKKAFESARARALESSIVIAYDDKNVSVLTKDKYNIAKLLITHSDKETWASVQVRDGEDLNRWVPVYYNLDSTSELGDLVKLLVDVIVSENNLESTTTSKRELIVPPYPKQSETCFSSAFFRCILNFFKPKERTIDTRVEQSNSIENKGVSTTNVILSAASTYSEILGKSIPDKAMIYTHGGAEARLANLTLLSEKKDSSGVVKYESPFALKAKEIIDNYGNDSLSQAAIQSQFWIIDWNFKDGHGAKVRSVVEKTLNDFGLNLKDYIREIDLAPHYENSDTLKKYVREYTEYLKDEVQIDAGLVDELKHEAITWINENKFEQGKDPFKQEESFFDQGKNSKIKKIHEFILYAALYQPIKFIVDGSHGPKHKFATINVSLEVESVAVRVLLEKQLWRYVGDNRFAIFAAAGSGHSWQPLSPFDVPQTLATNFVDVYNIAALDCDGLNGTSSMTLEGYSTSYPPPVHIVAQGCGFEYGSIVPSDYGSSFASPLVATTFWVRKLLHNNQALTIKDLINSTVPTVNSSVLHRSKFGGFFDQYAALIQAESFVFEKGALHAVESCSGNIQFESQPWIIFSSSDQKYSSSYEQIELAPVTCMGDKSDCIWVRYKNKKDGWGQFTLVPNAYGKLDVSFVSNEGGVKYLFNIGNVNYAKCKI